MSSFHQVAWIDHAVAHVYDVTREDAMERAVIHATDTGHGHVHHKAGIPGSGHDAVDHALLAQTAAALQDAHAILIVGPNEARHALKTYLDDHQPALAKHVIGVEPMEPSGSGEIHAFAHPIFLRADRM